MKNKHYVTLPDGTLGDHAVYKVVCLAHDVSDQLRLVEAQALANSLNLESCHMQDGFGAEEDAMATQRTSSRTSPFQP